MAPKKLYTPTGLPPIQSQNSQLQTSHTLMTEKKSKPATTVREPKQFSSNTMQGKPKAVIKNKNFRRVPSGHC